LIRLHQAPKEIEVFFVENEIDPTGRRTGSSARLLEHLPMPVQATGQRALSSAFCDRKTSCGDRSLETSGSPYFKPAIYTIPNLE